MTDFSFWRFSLFRKKMLIVSDRITAYAKKSVDAQTISL